MIKVILADDHQIVLDGLKLLLEQEKDIDLIGQALNGKEALTLLDSNHIDVAIIDVEMPELDGIETTRLIKQLYPTVKVLILTMYNKKEFITELIQIGASGYILKNRGKEELVEAVRKISIGKEYFGEAVTTALISSIRQPGKKELVPLQLTKRENEVLKLIAEGLSTPQISEKLFIAHSTVDTHRRNLIDKLRVPNSKALIRYAIQNGIID